MIYLLTAIGFIPGGSSTLHIYKQYTEWHKTNNTQNNTKIFRRVRAVPCLCELYPGISLTTEEKAQKYQKALVVRCPLALSEKSKTKC